MRAKEGVKLTVTVLSRPQEDYVTRFKKDEEMSRNPEKGVTYNAWTTPNLAPSEENYHISKGSLKQLVTRVLFREEATYY